MGIVNVTPDSFSDGGLFFNTDDAVAHAISLIEQGADILDIGAESTRPGAAQVSADEELRRVLPVIERVRCRSSIPLSIDTTKSIVASQALACGATIINDVSAGRFDAAMVDVVASNQCPVILMHSRKTPQTMQHEPFYTDVVREVKQELLSAVDQFIRRGVASERIIIDPGIGFAKRFEDNRALLANIGSLLGLGLTLCIGTSRKSFLGQITGKPVNQRCSATLASIAATYIQGATFFRVHDVAETVDFLKVFTALHGVKKMAPTDEKE
ncbi:MAG: dihydropteroate synthase [Chitinivibrionales bacterium]|nr:dihydropteroate synthase [Chitinivibrionales bacterium]